ncbi:MAG: DnaJ C-terminal domain-containing protein [Sphingorhabdus sp.]
MADPYSTLGVSKGADKKAIKSAYRTLAKQLHPDKNKDNPKAADRFSDVTKAYDLLSDKEKRAAFDRGEIDGEGNRRNPFGGGGPGAGGAGGFDFGNGGIDLGDIFEGIFGGGGAQARPSPFGGAQQPPRSARPPKGANIAYNHLVSFTDAATLAPQRITLRDGKTVEFKLPKGVVAGQQIRIPGKGQTGPGGNGDAMISLKIGKHPYFERDGDNIRLELPLSLREAIKGGKVKVPTVGKAVMLTIPKGVQGGTTMRLKGKGFSKKAGANGDQYVTLMIRLPEDKAVLDKITDLLPEDGDIRGDLGV